MDNGLLLSHGLCKTEHLITESFDEVIRVSHNQKCSLVSFLSRENSLCLSKVEALVIIEVLLVPIFFKNPHVHPV